MNLSLAFCFILTAHVTQGFVIQTRATALKGMQSTNNNNYRSAASWLLMSELDDNAENKQSLVKESVNVASGDKSDVKVNAAPGEIETQYPIDIPSPILLATSMLLAISSVGSLFQMFDSTASPISAAIALIGLPLCVFFFYAAITKAQAETEADDKAFLKDQRSTRNPNDFFN